MEKGLTKMGVVLPKLRLSAQFLLRLIVLLSIGIAAGCSSKKCLFQSDCGEGQVCAESQCRQACDEMRPCSGDFVCQSGACYPAEPTMCDEMGSCEMDMETQTVTEVDMSITGDAGQSANTDGGGLESFDAALEADGAVMPTDMAIMDMSLPLDAAQLDDSRFNLTGSYMVVHTVVFQNGGGPAEGEQEVNNIELTVISNNRYRVEVRDSLGVDVKYVDPAVNFAHRDGVGFYDFQYPWNIETEDEGCYHVEIRSQDGSYRQGPRGYTLTGRENRSTCTCLAEPINARVPTIDRSLCTGAYYEQVFDVQWNPL